MSAPNKTYTAGANAERSSILRKVRGMKRQNILPQTRADFETLEEWILQRNERYNKKPGGLGR